MNEDVKQKWIEALRSGKYEQGVGYLRSKDDKFCCLGVLCDILKDDLGLEWHVYEGDKSFFIGDSRFSVLPKVVAEYVDIRHDGELNVSHESFDSLWQMNDGGIDFNSIADFIENETDKIMTHQIDFKDYVD